MDNTEKLICHIISGQAIDRNCLHQQALIDFFPTALQHGVQGLVYYALKQQGIFTDLPQDLQNSFSRAVRGQVAVDLQREQELQTVLFACLENKINPLVLKGEALARTLYQLPATRERGDIDLFISLADIQKMIRIMHGLGYMITGPAYKSHQFTCRQLNRTNGRIHFDIHWRISNKASFAKTLHYDEALAQAVAIPKTTHGFTLCPEHSLLLACLHLAGMKNLSKQRIIWFYDIHLLLLSMNEKKLKHCADLAQKKNLQKICLKILLQTQQLLNTPVPQSLLSTLSQRNKKRFSWGKISQTNLGLVLCDVRELPGVSQKAYLLAELFFPPPEELLKRYNKSNQIWLPMLYFWYIVQGMANRILLR